MEAGATKTNWDLSPLFSSADDPKIEETRKKVAEESKKFVDNWKNRTDWLENPETLRKALDEYELFHRHIGSAAAEDYYFTLRTLVDSLDTNLKAKSTKSKDFGKHIDNSMRFFTLNISKIPKEKQKQFVESPQLKQYRHFLERLFARANYLLSEQEEKIMSLKYAAAHSHWVKLVSSLLSAEEREILQEDGTYAKKTYSDITNLFDSKNKEVRDKAAEALNDIFKTHAGIAEAEINAVLENKKADDLIRSNPRPDFSRHLDDDIDSGVIDTLVAAVTKRNNIAKRFYELKAKILGVRKLKYYERNLKIGNINKKYSYEEGLKLVNNVFQNLDPEFSEILQHLSSNGQIDVYPRKGKISGASCWYYLPTHPTYVMLNYTDDLSDVITLAHELGHASNNEIMRQKQNALNFGTSVGTAEVASTFMEDFVLQKLLNEADDELKLSIMMVQLDKCMSSIFRQIALYSFEQELHDLYREKGFLSKEEIGKLFQKHMSAYMGDFVEQSLGSENWWIGWSHIRLFFYVYSYASGLLISKFLQNEVRKDRKFIAKVKEFLSTGESASPKEIFSKLGVDISAPEFWNKGLDEIESLLDETEKLANKLNLKKNNLS